MMKPKPRKKKRTIGGAFQDAAQKRRARKGSRRIKRTLKDKSAPKASKAVSTKREDRRKRLKGEAKGKKWGKTQWSDKEKEVMKDTGVKVRGRKPKVVSTVRAKRAKRTLSRMYEQDKRRLLRKVK
jgi:hypothetical protein